MTTQEFDRLVNHLIKSGVDRESAAMTTVLMRKPNREKALRDWMIQHPKATSDDILKQAEIIAQTIEPTKHGVQQKK